jgi:hypothetical protein
MVGHTTHMSGFYPLTTVIFDPGPGLQVGITGHYSFQRSGFIHDIVHVHVPATLTSDSMKPFWVEFLYAWSSWLSGTTKCHQ